MDGDVKGFGCVCVFLGLFVYVDFGWVVGE